MKTGKGIEQGVSVIFLLFALLLTSCTSPKMPAEAEEALLTHWASLPSPPGLEHQIIQAWPGAVPQENEFALPPEMETWCVEARISAPDDPAVDGEKMVWIVTRQNSQLPWQAILLAAMSSLWPYEACGNVP